MWLWAEKYGFRKSVNSRYCNLKFSACKRSENFFNFMRYLDNIPTYQRYSDLRGRVGLLHLGVTVHNTAVCFKWFSFSGRGLATSYSGDFGEILFKHRQVRFKQKHILPPTGGNFTRLRFAAPWQASAMERQRNETSSQAEWNGASSSAVALRAMAGQASKSERCFCEERLSPREDVK